MMRKILVATDFSARSDRALRRATLLARSASASLVLVHVIDDDQPARLVEASRREATALLDELTRTLHEVDGVACEAKVMLGEPFQGLSDAITELDPDLIVMGPYRRQVLREVFMGTTVERTIRQCQRPVLMANAVPSQHYRRILIATDFSESSAHAVRTARNLGLLDETEVLLLHVFDAPAKGLMYRAAIPASDMKDYADDEERRAGSKMIEFVDQVGLNPDRHILKLAEEPASTIIKDCARHERADLVVVGTRGQSGIGPLLLGSVAQGVLQGSDVDVIAVPLLQAMEHETLS
jgi:nucleotide-binding universal stress UspA family protein